MKIAVALILFQHLSFPEAFTTRAFCSSTRLPNRFSEISALSATSLPSTRDRNLYEILNSSPAASRVDIKRQYIKLVKQSHPDALRSDTTAESEQQFQLVTEAWKILSNPLERKRYDRTLRAQKFTDDVESLVGNVANTAGPQFMRAFENVAIPFLRRSAATTVAGFNAVSQDVKNYSSTKRERQNDNLRTDEKADETIGIGAILSNAVVATQKAGKAIDIMELLEKSGVLRKQAKQELGRASKIRDELDAVMRKRVPLTLHTPNAKLSSLEAMIILDGFNTVDEVTVLDSVRLRKTVTYEIEQLKHIEEQMEYIEDRNRNIDIDLERKNFSLEQAKANATAAVRTEERARKALEDARALVQSTKGDVLKSELSLNSLVEDKRHALVDIDRLGCSIEKQQEKLRLSLRRKEQVLQDELGIRGDFGQEMVESAEVEVKDLLKQEDFLRAESARVQAKAERLESRSQKLIERASELEEEEEEAYKALEEGIRVAKRAAEGGYGKFDLYLY